MIEKAFGCVYDRIKTDVIQKGQVIKLADLTKLYNDNLSQSDDDAAVKIMGHNLRLKIERCPHLKDSIDFSSSQCRHISVL